MHERKGTFNNVTMTLGPRSRGTEDGDPLSN